MNYIKLQTLTDTIFGLFTIVWLFLRHFAFIYLLYVIAYDPLNLRIPMEWNPEKGIYLTWPMLSMFLALLSGLQVLMVIWFFMICKVIAKVVSGAKAEDIRSDDEE
jgi:acyl-CoA-dependent ceramide synthase